MHRLLLLTKIKGNKVYFGKLVTFLGRGGWMVNLPPTYPLHPLESVSRGQPAQKIFKRGGQPKFQVSGGGSDPLGPPILRL